MKTITDSSASFISDGINKADIIHDCATGELFMVKKAKSGTMIEIYPTWQAVCVGIWLKLKSKVSDTFKREN